MRKRLEFRCERGVCHEVVLPKSGNPDEGFDPDDFRRVCPEVLSHRQKQSEIHSLSDAGVGILSPTSDMSV
jgi:hypothetical protein